MDNDNGHEFIGIKKNGLANGQGKAIYASGDKYTGQWKDHEMHGKGV